MATKECRDYRASQPLTHFTVVVTEFVGSKYSRADTAVVITCIVGEHEYRVNVDSDLNGELSTKMTLRKTQRLAYGHRNNMRKNPTVITDDAFTQRMFDAISREDLHRIRDALLRTRARIRKFELA